MESRRNSKQKNQGGKVEFRPVWNPVGFDQIDGRRVLLSQRELPCPLSKNWGKKQHSHVQLNQGENQVRKPLESQWNSNYGNSKQQNQGGELELKPGLTPVRFDQSDESTAIFSQHELPCCSPGKKQGTKKKKKKKKKKKHSPKESNQGEDHEKKQLEWEPMTCVLFRNNDYFSVYGLHMEHRPVELAKLETRIMTFGNGCIALDMKLFLIGGDRFPEVPKYPRSVWIYNWNKSKHEFEKGPEFQGAKPRPLLFSWDHKIYALAGLSMTDEDLEDVEYPDPAFEVLDTRTMVWSKLPNPPYHGYAKERYIHPTIRSYSIFNDILHVFVSLPEDAPARLYCFNLTAQKWCEPDYPSLKSDPVMKIWLDYPLFPIHELGGMWPFIFPFKDPAVCLLNFNDKIELSKLDLRQNLWGRYCYYMHKEGVAHAIHGLPEELFSELDYDTLDKGISILDAESLTFCVIIKFKRDSEYVVRLCKFKLDINDKKKQLDVNGIGTCDTIPDTAPSYIDAKDVSYKTFTLGRLGIGCSRCTFNVR